MFEINYDETLWLLYVVDSRLAFLLKRKDDRDTDEIELLLKLSEKLHLELCCG